MLKENWEEKHGINLPGHPTCAKGIQGPQVGNLILQTPQGVSNNNNRLPGSSSRRNLTALAPSGSINEPKHRFENHFHHQNHLLQTQQILSSSPCENVESQLQPSSNLQELIKLLSTGHGLQLKMPLEMGSSEYLGLVEILQQNYVQLNGFLEQSGSYSIVGGTNNTQSVEIASLAPSVSTHQDEISRTVHNDEETIKMKDAIALADDELSICRDNSRDKIVGRGQKNDPIYPRSSSEKLWDGSLQLSSSVTLSAVAFFKSGEKLLGNNWPEIIEVKGKVRLEAFEKYVQDLPRSRNRGLMVISLCWKRGSSDTGLSGMKVVAKGYKRSSRVGFAQLLSGIDLYICPRSDPIITILAKYGFFKGMSVIDDNQDSMIGCVVWRKNRPLNPVGNNTLDSKTSPNAAEPQNPSSSLSMNQGAEKKLSPEKLGLELGQHEEVDHNLVKKMPFEDDDLPEFDFGIACQKSTLVSQSPSQPLNPTIFRNNGSTSVNCQNLDNSSIMSGKSTVVSQSQPLNAAIFTNDGSMSINCHNLDKSGLVSGKSTLVSQSQPLDPVIFRNNGPTLVNCQNLDNSGIAYGKSTVVSQSQPLDPVIFSNNGSTSVNCQKQDNSVNGSSEPLPKKTKLFDNDDDDMPEWCPPQLRKQIPPSNFKNLPSCPPRPAPIPPPPLPAGTRPAFSYQPFQPQISFPATTFAGAPPPPPPLLRPPPPPPSGRFSSSQPLRHWQSSSFPSSNGKRARP